MSTLYCTTDDVTPLLGSTPVPDDLQSFVDAAGEEIDSKIGFKYATPVVASTGPSARAVMLLMKRTCSWLAAGRCVLARNATGSDDQLHQYGKYLVDQAMVVIQGIVDGSIVLIGVPSATLEEVVANGPLIANVDEDSYVEAFTATIGNPLDTVLATPRCDLTGNPYTW